MLAALAGGGGGFKRGGDRGAVQVPPAVPHTDWAGRQVCLLGPHMSFVVLHICFAVLHRCFLVPHGVFLRPHTVPAAPHRCRKAAQECRAAGSGGGLADAPGMNSITAMTAAGGEVR